jgi:hypothetical protein
MTDGDSLLMRCGGRQGRDGIYSIRTDAGGGPSLLVDLEQATIPLRGASVTPDGRWLLMDRAFDQPIPANFLLLADLTAKEPSNLRSLLPDVPIVRNGRFSPDGRWFCYLSQTSGGMELYVRRFNGEEDPGPPILAAVGAIESAAWGPAATPGVLDLRYRDDHSREFGVAIDTRSGVHVLDPRLTRDFSALEPGLADWVESPDGRLFGIQRDEDEDDPTVAEVTVSWFDVLSRLAPPGR